MEIYFIILLVCLIIAVFFIQKQFNSKIKELKELNKNNDEQSVMIQIIDNLRKEIEIGSTKNRQELDQKLEVIRKTLDRGMDFSSKSIQEQFKESRDLIKETSRKITQFEETNKRIEGFAGKLQSLENILKNPKQRGILGEYYLETILKNVFEPNQYQMQYKFKDGNIVDAVIFYQDKILPIDSKFSLENYNKIIEEKDNEKRKTLSKNLVTDLKKRIDETSKYIKTKEKTFDFAFMFIPSEAVYYDMLQAKIGTLKEASLDLIEFAHKKNVVLVSPSSFYAYLQTILHGLRLVSMKESMNLFKQNIEKLDKHLKAFEINYNKVGTHLSTTLNAYNNSSKELNKIDKDIYKITKRDERKRINANVLEKPEINV